MAHRSRRELILPLVVLSLAAAGSSGAASRDVIHAARGQVRAELTWTKVRVDFRHVEIRIQKPGVRYVRRLGTWYVQRPTLHLRDLDADGEPEVWVDTYTGGAHCCWVSWIFRFADRRGSYVGAAHTWGNVAYRLENVDRTGPPEFVTSDDRFAYVFTSFAASVFPRRIWRLEGGRLVDVTKSLPTLVERDRAKLWKAYLSLRRERLDVRGVLAAWMADEALLGREDAGWKTLEKIRRRGELGPRPDLAGWPQGRSYLKTLKAFLRKLGYLVV
jgi:hypothetical protein